MTIEEFYQIHELDLDFDHEYYLKHYPNVVDFYQPYCLDNNISDRHRLYYHYILHGKMNGNKPHGPIKNSIKHLRQKHKTLYLKPIHGIGNRIYNISSCYDFVKQFDFKKLKIYWCSSAGFSDEKFEDLFDVSSLPADIEFISKEEYDDAEKTYFTLDNFISQDSSSLNYIYEEKIEEIIDCIVNYSFCYSWFARLEWVFPDLINITDQFIDYIKPANRLCGTINSIVNQFPKDIIGLHIRRGDAFKSLYGYKYQVSSDEAFINLLKFMDEPNFFLATDCIKAQNKIINNTDKNIIYLNKEFISDDINDTDTKPNQKNAVIELFLLSHTNKIYGTNYSTFGKLAAQIGKIDFEEVKISNYPHSFESTLPDLSLTVGIKNRFKALKFSIHSWLQHNDIKEILIIDWDSKDLDYNYIESLDSRINILRFRDKKNYNIPEVLNLCINNANYEHILKMDVDYVFNPYYSIREWLHLDWETEFLSSIWTQKSLDNGLGFMENLNGFLAVKKEHILGVGGYDESFVGYGWEDCDIRNKLVYERKLKLKILPIENNYVPVYHIPHLDNIRTKYQIITDKDKSLAMNKQKSKYKESI